MKKTFKQLAVLFALIVAFSYSGHAQIVVKVRPVAPVVRVRPIPPSPRHIWIDGEWVYRDGRYIWVDGHWLEPRPDYRWINGHWKHRRGGWVWVPGHWQRV